MKTHFILILTSGLALIGNVLGTFLEYELIERVSGVFFLLSLFGFFFLKFNLKNSNLYGFLVFALLANLIPLLREMWFLSYIVLGSWLVSFVFLVKEALRYTQYNKGKHYMLLYFLLIVGIYAYLFSIHVIEIGEHLNDSALFTLYIIYYLNLLVLGITALIYYLNSFSKKAVFFTCLALAFILADVLRDMKVFYFKDTSVEIAAGIIRCAALVFVFLFFGTKEKKLKLLNLV